MKTSTIDISKNEKLIGSRLKSARELCGMTQRAAAKRLGYANSSYLSKIEGAFVGRVASTNIICQAAKLYGVSADYLLGLSDEWDIDEHHDHQINITGQLYDAWEKARKCEISAINKTVKQVSVINSVATDLTEVAFGVHACFLRFTELNPKFVDMRGGAKLLMVINDGVERSRMARSMMKRFYSECRISEKQLDIFGSGDGKAQ